MLPTHSFRKGEHLCSTRLIETLFGSGSTAMSAFPLRAVYRFADGTLPDGTLPGGAAPVKVLVSVSKKRFHHAVDRNRVKRQLREAYRLQKQLLTDNVPQGRQLLLAFIWVADSHVPSAVISARMNRLLKRIAGKICQ